jgi:hypothetical protein
MQRLRHDRLRRPAAIGGLLGFLLLPAPLGGDGGATTIRVSIGSTGGQADEDSLSPSISGDGRFVAFESAASNLVPGDANASTDVFVRDVKTGTTWRVSVDSVGGEADGDSSLPSLSTNGRFVAFRSAASNLVPGDTNGLWDVFVRDVKTASTTRVSVDSAGGEADGDSFFPSISGNGRVVAFSSVASNLVPGDSNTLPDVFVHDARTRSTTLVSVDSAGGEADGDSFFPSISGNGRVVAFSSAASNLVPGDSNGLLDVFVRDLKTGSTTRVSVGSSGGQGNGIGGAPSISGNGRFVAFWSVASSLVPDDTNGSADVFVHDGKTGTTTRVSLDSSGAQAMGAGVDPSISGNGRSVAFVSGATTLVPADTNGALDVFLRRR